MSEQDLHSFLMKIVRTEVPLGDRGGESLLLGLCSNNVKGWLSWANLCHETSVTSSPIAPFINLQDIAKYCNIA